jgi:translation initiation factor IF-2
MSKQINAVAAVEVSARTGAGLEALEQAIADAAERFQFDPNVNPTISLPEVAIAVPKPAEEKHCC